MSCNFIHTPPGSHGFSQAIAKSAEAFRSGRRKQLCGKIALTALGAVALGAIITFGILGLLQTSGAHHMPGILGKAIDGIQHKAVFGTMIGSGGSIAVVTPLIIQKRREMAWARMMKDYNFPPRTVAFNQESDDDSSDETPKAPAQEGSLLDRTWNNRHGPIGYYSDSD